MSVRNEAQTQRKLREFSGLITFHCNYVKMAPSWRPASVYSRILTFVKVTRCVSEGS